MLPFLRNSRWDLLLVFGSFAHGVLLLLLPSFSENVSHYVLSVVAVAIGLWWNSNTVAHYFIHAPFFRQRFRNRLFSYWQTAVTGIPQQLWRERHLAHHAERPWKFRWGNRLISELALLLVISGLWLSIFPEWFLKGYLPGWALGLVLCQLQGHFEHVAGTTSHYGKIYNCIFFNDGYHVEHHLHPARHWRELPRTASRSESCSPLPSVLRWLEPNYLLNALERAVINKPAWQRFVIERHLLATERLLQEKEYFHRILIVGGGLFPRSAIVLRKLFPAAQITVLDLSRGNLELASQFLPPGIQLECGMFNDDYLSRYDLVVVPLAFRGSRNSFYSSIAGEKCVVLVHDWIWRPRGKSAVVSWCLLKRLNRVEV
jgi:hypothetical protein